MEPFTDLRASTRLHNSGYETSTYVQLASSTTTVQFAKHALSHTNSSIEVNRLIGYLLLYYIIIYAYEIL